MRSCESEPACFASGKPFFERFLQLDYPKEGPISSTWPVDPTCFESKTVVYLLVTPDAVKAPEDTIITFSATDGLKVEAQLYDIHHGNVITRTLLDGNEKSFTLSLDTALLMNRKYMIKILALEGTGKYSLGWHSESEHDPQK